VGVGRDHAGSAASLAVAPVIPSSLLAFRSMIPTVQDHLTVGHTLTRNGFPNGLRTRIFLRRDPHARKLRRLVFAAGMAVILSFFPLY